MELNLSVLLGIPPFTEGSTLTKNHDPHERIKSITVMDIMDVDLWCKPHELIIIGDFFKHNIPLNFLDSLKQRKCAGIVTKTKFTSYISDKFIKHADSLKLPIIVVPDRYSWSELMNPVNETILRNQSDKILNIEKFQLFLIQILLKDTSFKDIANQISQVINAPIALVDINESIIDKSDDFPDISINNLKFEKSKSYTLISNQNEENNLENYVWKLQDYNIWYFSTSEFGIFFRGVMVLLPKETKHISHSLNLQIVLLVQIMLLKSRLFKDAYQDNSRMKELFLKDLLDKKDILSTNKLKYEIVLGHIFESSYHLCCVKILDKNSYNKYYGDMDLKRLETYLFNNIDFKDKLIIFDYENDQFLLFIGSSITNIQQKIQTLNQLFNRFFNTQSIYLGVSQKHSLEDCNISLKEAKEAVSIAIKLGTKKHYHFYSNLGFFRLLTNKNGDLETIYYNELINTFVMPIIEYDKKNNSELYSTITKYIDSNFSIQHTSEELFIHVNTLRSRLKRIEQILHIDLNNSHNLLNLHIALEIYKTRINIDNEDE